MTQTLQLRSMGSSGINSDIASFELPVEYITSGINFRISNGKLLPFSGSNPVMDAPEEGLDAGFIFAIKSIDDKSIVIGTDTSVWVSEKLEWTNISSEVYPISADTQLSWSADMLGQYLIMNHPDLWPEFYLNASVLDTLEPLNFSPEETWKDVGYRCGIIRTHKNFLIALDIEDQYGVSPNAYRISHPADADGLPFTWDENDRSSIAIRAQLGSNGGRILDGLSLRDSFCIYSEYSIDFLDYNAGSEFYWQRRELSSTYGLLSKDCVVEVNGNHFFMTSNNDIVMNDGNQLVSIIDSKLVQRFVSNTNQNARISSYVVKNDLHKEIWFCQPEGDSLTANIAYIYDWLHNTWSIRTLPVTSIHAAYGKNPLVEGESDDIGKWNAIQSTWESINISWGTESRLVIEDSLVGLSSDGALISLDVIGSIQEDDFDCILERLDYPLVDVRETNTVTRVYPMATGSEFILQFGSSDYAGGGVRWEPEQVFIPSKQRKLDFRTTGELFNYRIKSIGQSRFKFSGLLMEYSPSGKR